MSKQESLQQKKGKKSASVRLSPFAMLDERTKNKFKRGHGGHGRHGWLLKRTNGSRV